MKCLGALITFWIEHKRDALAPWGVRYLDNHNDTYYMLVFPVSEFGS